MKVEPCSECHHVHPPHKKEGHHMGDHQKTHCMGPHMGHKGTPMRHHMEPYMGHRMGCHMGHPKGLPMEHSHKRGSHQDHNIQHQYRGGCHKGNQMGRIEKGPQMGHQHTWLKHHNMKHMCGHSGPRHQCRPQQFQSASTVPPSCVFSQQPPYHQYQFGEQPVQPQRPGHMGLPMSSSMENAHKSGPHQDNTYEGGCEKGNHMQLIEKGHQTGHLCGDLGSRQQGRPHNFPQQIHCAPTVPTCLVVSQQPGRQYVYEEQPVQPQKPGPMGLPMGRPIEHSQKRGPHQDHNIEHPHREGCKKVIHMELVEKGHQTGHLCCDFGSRHQDRPHNFPQKIHCAPTVPTCSVFSQQPGHQCVSEEQPEQPQRSASC